MIRSAERILRASRAQAGPTRTGQPSVSTYSAGNQKKSSGQEPTCVRRLKSGTDWGSEEKRLQKRGGTLNSKGKAAERLSDTCVCQACAEELLSQPGSCRL